MRLTIFFKILFSLLLVLSSLNGGVIKIAVAANVSYAIDDLKKEFNKLYPNTNVKVILGSSGKLTAQIIHGAPFEIFMSANMKYPNTLYKNKMAITKPLVYAQGSLSILSATSRDISNISNLLRDKKIRRIAVANPKTAPYGIATREALKNAGVYDSIKKKFVYGESISQTLSYTVSATDVGIVATSSLYSKRMVQFKKGTHWSELDTNLYTPINQGIVILKHGADNTEVKAFYDFMLSEKAKEILKRFGYLL